ncbi:hypothetical protein [Saccharicrinis fermentans]|uniref:Uncharacterized protein n=1 Tax=Saccharicrinis fermentans DSM 9555 = JCM 21142 TaxID=869213 RepID=W7YBM3_9BACT|nr:hypothetical protein [Saccharicrinis fermentans]GAF05832.1 hypothetical protein JCM21142_114586 [Saccharicrinis fermentans DSM 9555 = JCM 21142]
MKYRIYQLLSLMFIVTSCTKDDEVLKKDVFYPLSVGNKWTYEIYNANNNLSTEEQFFSVVKDTILISESELYEAFIVETYTTSEDNYKWKIFQGHDSNSNLVQYGAQVQGASIIDKSIQFRKNVKTGDSWNYNHLVYNEEDGIRSDVNEMECIKLDTTITTKAGTFTCIKYYDKFKRRESSNEKNLYYINPEVGLIRYTLIYNGKVLIETSLKEYHIVD